MFRLQDNTPSIYCEQSRDFQLFCRLYDVVNNSVKFNIDSINNINDPNKIKDSLLSLMCAKVGFFPKHEYNTQLLRGIVNSFPYIIKNKGCLKGIEKAIVTVLKHEDISGQFSIIYNTEKGYILIYLPVALENKEALEDILSYVIPIGYSYDVKQYSASNIESPITLVANVSRFASVPTVNISQTRGSDRIFNTEESNVFNFKDDLHERVVSLVGWNVIGSQYTVKDGETTANYKIFKKNGETDSDRNGTVRDTIYTSDEFGYINETSKDG